MIVPHLLGLAPAGLFVSVRWKGLNNSQDSGEPTVRVYKDAPDLLKKLL